MDENCNFALGALKIEGTFEIAPVHLHYLNAHLTELMKVISEMEKNGGNRRKISVDLGIKYSPVCEGP